MAFPRIDRAENTYELGYRLLSFVEKTGRFNTPYVTIGVNGTLEDAQTLYNQMIQDFPMAEFRILEVTNAIPK